MKTAGEDLESYPTERRSAPAAPAGRNRIAPLRSYVPAAPAFAAVALFILWAAHDGGYDEDTWYWGALMLLGLLVASRALPGRASLTGPAKVALLALALYVAWSYLSITWASSKGDALTGSNRALLYLLVFTLFASTAWRTRWVLAVLLLYALGVGTIGVEVLLRMAQGHGSALFTEGRLVSPTGYFNSSAALSTSAGLVALALSVRRDLPVIVRGVLLAVACEGVQLALLAQSRGWLFTLPVVLGVTLLLVQDRLRVAAWSIVPIVASLALLQPLLDVFRASQSVAPAPQQIQHAAQHAGELALLTCGIALVIGALLAAVEARARIPTLSRTGRRAIGTAAAVLALIAAGTGGAIATHGHPFRFIRQQWNGFVHPSATATNPASHFAVVGSERYDAWRVALDALLAHPIGGLGQDNFADYYVIHRHTDVELQWTHSIELRLLAHTGLVGFALFAAFLLAALMAALRVRRRGEYLARGVAAAALLPLVVWLIHGSVDWFWEMPALSGPALGFLAMAGSLRGGRLREEKRADPEATPAPAGPAPTAPGAAPRFAPARSRFAGATTAHPLAALAAGIALMAAVLVLAFPYLSVREVSTATDLRQSNPEQALRDLSTAAKLNPLDPAPARLAGTIALQLGQFTVAQQRFKQATSREPGDWFAWLGAGLAASGLGETSRANHDYQLAARINSRQPAVTTALAKVYSAHPLTPSQAIQMLVVAH